MGPHPKCYIAKPRVVDRLVLEKMICEEVYFIWAWQPFLSCSLNCKVTFGFEATETYRLKYIDEISLRETLAKISMVNLGVRYLSIVSVSLDSQYLGSTMTLATTVTEKSNFQDYSHKNSLKCIRKQKPCHKIGSSSFEQTW